MLQHLYTVCAACAALLATIDSPVRLELSLTAESPRNLRFSETSMLQDDVQRSQTTIEGDTKVLSKLN